MPLRPVSDICIVILPDPATLAISIAKPSVYRRAVNDLSLSNGSPLMIIFVPPLLSLLISSSSSCL
ncbi:hypothetical protein [Vulcanisaeta sp. JCM 16161]|uniref:hypothetical protein n=1 Tax=Vulcanisaeta sp. JCM 16161 TaxID=1295372 RepID=UPI00406C92FA